MKGDEKVTGRSPVLVLSDIPNGFERFKNATKRFVYAVNSTMTMLSLTSTIFAPN